MAPAEARKEGILDAAQTLVLKHGLRGTSMEAIARQAGVAKPTLYAYYPDKPAVFAALLERLIGTWRAEFLAALRGDGDVVQRIAAAITAKHKAAWRLLENSPHADELYEEHDRGWATQFTASAAQTLTNPNVKTRPAASSSPAGDNPADKGEQKPAEGQRKPAEMQAG